MSPTTFSIAALHCLARLGLCTFNRLKSSSQGKSRGLNLFPAPSSWICSRICIQYCLFLLFTVCRSCESSSETLNYLFGVLEVDSTQATGRYRPSTVYPFILFIIAAGAVESFSFFDKERGRREEKKKNIETDVLQLYLLFILANRLQVISHTSFLQDGYGHPSQYSPGGHNISKLFTRRLYHWMDLRFEQGTNSSHWHVG